MRFHGFTLSDVEITVGETGYDLHNNFNFSGLAYDVANQTLILRWQRCIGDWVPVNTPHNLEIQMRGVSHLSAKSRDLKKPFTEDDCLGTVLVVAADKTSEESYGAIERVDEDMHVIFEFMSGFAVRVQAEEATCVVA
ncbi:hypothetical protein [Rhodoferax aquaticus]|uniref:Uncharacterized protein n=1 Tax=Rhodoferax aquaticus TaxID=2527691 RepID=A0A515EJV6_9BURK|nr:hypothetical protein [Rhodoferax aquaticus]QDL52943.1 hypothetical protein EXZ61_01455 [Rhodoferax aquaticus]